MTSAWRGASGGAYKIGVVANNKARIAYRWRHVFARCAIGGMDVHIFLLHFR